MMLLMSQLSPLNPLVLPNFSMHIHNIFQKFLIFTVAHRSSPVHKLPYQKKMKEWRPFFNHETVQLYRYNMQEYYYVCVDVKSNYRIAVKKLEHS